MLRTLEHQPIQKPTFVREDERGSFVEITNTGPWETVVTGSMKSGAVLGHHYHKKTDLFLFLLFGAAEVVQIDVATLSRREQCLGAHDGLSLLANHAHSIRFTAMSQFILLKSRAYCDDDPDTFSFPIE